MMRAVWAFALVAFSGALGQASAEGAAQFRRDGASIVYDGTIGRTSESVVPDADILREMLNGDSSISTIILSGAFEQTSDALDVARVIEDFHLATEIDGTCTDACLYMFVAGERRALTKGSKIGLRRRMVSASFLRDSFADRQVRYGWKDEFGQAVVMYDIAQSDMYWSLRFLMDRGVSIDFALNVFATPREDMWWPDRDDLVAGGVIAE